MENKNLQLSIGSYFGIIVLLGIFLAIYMQEIIFETILEFTNEEMVKQSKISNEKTTNLFLSLEKIKFDTSALNSEYIQSLTPFPDFPIDAESVSNFGKANPFLGNFTIITDIASSTGGGVIYSGQRSLNNGEAIIQSRPTR